MVSPEWKERKPLSDESLELSTQDRVIHQFLELIYKEELHPDDAALKMGLNIAVFEALRPEKPALEAAWHLAAHRKRGKIQKPKTPLEMKQRMGMQWWDILAPKITKMLMDIPDGKKGQDLIMELIRNKFIGETLPKETVSHVEMEQTIDIKKKYEKLDMDKLAQLADGNSHQIAELQRELEDSKRRQAGVEGAVVTDAEFSGE